MTSDLDLELVREIAFDADGPSLETRQRARDALLAAAGRDTRSARRTWHGPLTHPGWRRVRDFTTVGIRATPVLLAVLVTLAIAVVALTEIGHHAPRRPVSSAAVSGRKQLIEILAVLRRPQTKADSGLSPASPPDPGVFLGAPDLSLVRFATVTPWGEKLFFVPFKPPTRRRLAAAERQFPQRDRAQLAQDFARLALRGETLGVYSRQGGGGGVPASVIKARGELSTEGAGRSFAQAGPRERSSRAAEQNPSTPNRIWVTPRTGGPRTTFALHFRILLNDADYHSTFTGTNCPAITFRGGSGGGANNLRGRSGLRCVMISAA